jgi:hypothetical protein
MFKTHLATCCCTKRRNRTKRRKTNNKRAVKVEQEEPFALLQPLLELVESRHVQRDEQSFEYLISGLLPEYLQDRKKLLEKETESDIHVSLDFKVG